MNLDELQKQWDSQEVPNEIPTIDLHTKSNVNSILHILRRNILLEFVMWLVGLGLIIYFTNTSYFNFSGSFKILFYFFILQLIISGFLYYKRFYYFYRSTQKQELLSSRENLLTLYYDLKFAIETYKSTSYLITPSLVLIYLFMFTHEEFPNWLESLYDHGLFAAQNSDKTMTIFIIVLGTISLMIIMIEMMAYFTYSKYLKKIKKVLDDLDQL